MADGTLLDQAGAAFEQAVALAKGWLLSPAAWTQFALLIAAYGLSVLANRIIVPRLRHLLTPPDTSLTLISKARRFMLLFTPLLLPLIAYALTAAGEQLTRQLFGAGDVIAFGKRVFLFLAARIFVKQIVTDPFLNLLGRFILIPVAALYAVGLLDTISLALTNSVFNLGNISFSAMSLLRGVIAGSLLFWLGSWSNGQSTSYIGKQPMRPAIRQLSIKATEFAIFGIAFLLLMNIMGISLTSLAVIGGAVGVGIGFGLQQIASNFISGVILLLEGQATVGDFVELDGGEKGQIVKLTARATVLKTFDGRQIMVPNEHFITTRVTNYSDSGSPNRYEALFSVSYDTDINLVPAIIIDAVSKHPDILQSPEGPDVELRGFGESGIDFACEFWVAGIDDGANSYTSDVLFLIWNALKAHNIDIPFPHRVIEIKGQVPPVST